jgi:DNA-binding IclR family transcriptional regulator
MKLSSLEKSLQVVNLLSKNPKGLSLSEISKMLGAPASTIHHILDTFRAHDYISQDPETKRYSLGYRFLSIGSTILENIDIRKTAHNHLLMLHQKCSETVNLWILRAGEVTLIDKIQKVGGLTLDTYIGFRTGPHASAAGKVLLADLTENAVIEIYKSKPLKIYGRNTLSNMTQLLEELENIRKQGYAIDNEEYYEGVRCVAAPIKSGEKVIAALSISGSVFGMTMERINRELIDLVVKTGQEISSVLKW